MIGYIDSINEAVKRICLAEGFLEWRVERGRRTRVAFTNVALESSYLRFAGMISSSRTLPFRQGRAEPPA